ncbi:DUF1206 domain-containing protein [Aquimarina sp. SS2-1]|uniref:DUF1206 domain-containing protein n=1 Tax=Aquimarina besae TaxID=3342247 RepID=UPI003672494D
MDSKIKKVVRVGYGAKGIVYAITGILAFMTAFNMGGEKAGKLQVIRFLEEQSFGKIILAILGLGLICYAVWRFIQSISDPEEIGTDGKGIVKRVSFFISGAVYLALGFFSIIEIFKEPGHTNNSSNLGNYSSYIFIGIGSALAIKSIYQFVKAYKGDFLKKFNISKISSVTLKTLLKRIGYVGLISRGIVIAIIAYFFIKGGMNATSSSSGEIKGTSEAFSFIQQNTSGPWIFGLVALGLLCYGIYMFAMVKYRSFDD